MIPTGRGYVPAESVAPHNGVRHSAVLLLLVPTDHRGPDAPCSSFELPLIRRTLDDGPHSGQIALPGGAEEPNDGGPVGTAIREAHEEIGIAPEAVTPVGTLTSLYIDVSGFVITPVVAVLTRQNGTFWSGLRPQESEVARIIPASLETITRSKKNRTVRARGYRLTVPSYLVDGDIVWGATAMIIAELLEVYASLQIRG